MMGLFLLDAFSKAKQESEAYSLPPISTLIVSADLFTTIART